MESERHLEALNRITNRSAKAAYLDLLIAFERQGFRTSPNSGHAIANRVYDPNGAYVFAYIANAAHLLFYVRHPAFDAFQGLRDAALHAGLGFSSNAAGELTLRIETTEDAEKALSWLGQTLDW